MNELRQGLRAIAGMPMVAIVVTLSMAIGIGANTVVFSWIQARILEPIPGVSGGSRFWLVEPRKEGDLYPGGAWIEYGDLKEQVKSFEALFAFRIAPMYVGRPGQVERVFGVLASANYFSALGLRPAAGRFLEAHDVQRPGAEPVAVISYGLWQTLFEGDAQAIGRSVRVNGRELTVIGVTPDEFQGTVMGLNFDVWVPATMAPALGNGAQELTNRDARGYTVMGRLQRGSSRDQAQAELEAAMQRLAETYPDTNRNMTAEILRIWQSPRGPQRMLNAALFLLQAIMLLLLLAVCGNMANLMLARASTRQKEVGVRLALGARPARIARLLLLENVLLALPGAALGALIAVWGTKALLVIPLVGLPLRFQTSVDGQGLAFALALGVLSGLFFGAAPAIHLSRTNPLAAVRAGSRSAGRNPLRHVLMASQVALALIVLIVAGLFFQSIRETRDVDPGFRREGVMLAAYDLSGRASDANFNRNLAARVLDGVRALPGVESAAIAAAVPLDIHGLPSRSFTLEGRARDDGRRDEALSNVVTPGYFEVMGIPFRSGQDFAELLDPAAPLQAIVNETFVRRYLAGVEPLGRQVEARGRTYVIRGVVRDSLSNAFGEPPTPVIYFSYRDAPPPRGEIHVRTRNASAAISADVRRVVRGLDPELPVFNVRSMTDHVETNLLFRRIPARMFAVLGPMLLLLAAIGIYAVVAYAVSLRTTEIGVRLAIGATRPQVVSQFVGQSMAVVGLGAIAGWALAFVATVAFAPGGRIDLLVFVAVPVVLLAVAALACWLPAHRASQLDPVIALRAE
jgi:predicted permease